ncbi:hypothetical protein AC629_21690 [Bradyrhizobium sp. NAS80.1]|nr:hypothetical protein AC629_21690 [Bradyrhizobium sp. NAS80.1]
MAISLKSFSAARPFAPRQLESLLETVIDVIVDQCLLGIFDRALHGLQLLRYLDARLTLLDHLDDLLEVAVGALQALGNRGVRMVLHTFSNPPGRISMILLAG